MKIESGQSGKKHLGLTDQISRFKHLAPLFTFEVMQL